MDIHRYGTRSRKQRNRFTFGKKLFYIVSHDIDASQFGASYTNKKYMTKIVFEKFLNNIHVYIFTAYPVINGSSTVLFKLLNFTIRL